MSLKIILIVATFAVLGNGIPLENPTEDMSKFFSPRIVGGIDAPEAYAPHMAALVVGQDFIGLVCGGSIVTPNLIMSAAHCIDSFVIWDQLLSTFHGVVGTNRWDSRGHAVQFKDYYLHPQWNWSTIKYDIGFLKLAEELKITSTVGVVPVNFQRIEGNAPCFVTGWGLLGAWSIIPYDLQLLDVTTISHDACVAGIEAAGAESNSRPPAVDSEIEICTFHSVGRGMCNGDSGSALVQRETNTQIGIVSWGFPCAVGAPDVFVRMSGFQDYYEEVVASIK